MESEKSSREKGIYKVTIVGSIVNFLLLVFKFFAGIAGHSAAMLADAVHSLSDFITDIVVIVFVRIAGKPEDKGHDYGHGKYETLATAIIGLLLLCVGFGIFWEWGFVYLYFFAGRTVGVSRCSGIGGGTGVDRFKGDTLSVYSDSGQEVELPGCDSQLPGITGVTRFRP